MTQRLPRRQWLLLAPALLATFGARAQPNDPPNPYPPYGQGGGTFFRVIRATYGTERRNVDVTDRVQQLVAQDRQFTASNQTFRTDPAPRQTKTLWIEAEGRNGMRRTFAYREGDRVDGAQFRSYNDGPGHGGGRPQPGWDRIEQAVFGVDGRGMDVTQRVRQLLQQGRPFPVDPQSMGGDPAYGQTKYLHIRLRGRGRPQIYKEGDWVDPQQLMDGGYPR
ncbi:MAG: hypothetical protein QM569_02820 [Acidovorax sp.]|uniref:hypothetical protein n=1 Tax=Acidovorax sp. TaxID=1872122 RepID=UPI0039E39730